MVHDRDDEQRQAHLTGSKYHVVHGGYGISADHKFAAANRRSRCKNRIEDRMPLTSARTYIRAAFAAGKPEAPTSLSPISSSGGGSPRPRAQRPSPQASPTRAVPRRARGRTPCPC